MLLEEKGNELLHGLSASIGGIGSHSEDDGLHWKVSTADRTGSGLRHDSVLSAKATWLPTLNPTY